MRAFAGLVEKENTLDKGEGGVDPGRGSKLRRSRWRLRGAGGGVIYAFN